MWPFGRKETQAAAGLAALGVDIHSHLLPGLDDGAATPAQAAQLARELAGMGYRKLVTTPHVKSGLYDNTPDSIGAGLALLRQTLKDEGVDIDIEAAAEYFVDFAFLERLRSGVPLLTFGGGHLLVETSLMEPLDQLPQILFDLQLAGYRVVLAHPERYPYWSGRRRRELEELRGRDILLQLNLASLAGFYGPGALDTARWLVDAGLVSFAGSDCHNPKYIDALRQVPRTRHYRKLIESGRLLNDTL